jgi:hypothetical protein
MRTPVMMAVVAARGDRGAAGLEGVSQAAARNSQNGRIQRMGEGIDTVEKFSAKDGGGELRISAD